MAVAALSLLVTGCGKKNLKVCIFPGDYPDPTILRDGNDYYMTHSNFTYYPGLLIWHSTDLLHWEPIARAVQGHDYSIYAPASLADKFARHEAAIAKAKRECSFFHFGFLS